MDSRSLLLQTQVDLAPGIAIRIPTVGEILQNERLYYQTTYSLTATPFQNMVQLDDLGIDFTTISEWQLFIQTFLAYAHSGDLLDYVFADLQTQGFGIYQDPQTAALYLSNPDTGVQIHESTYLQIVELIRKINLYEHIIARPANETARQYLIEKERKRLKRLAKKPPEPYLEQMVIALVNTAEFPYDYESCMHLSIYAFNQSFKQIQHKINYDNTMIGIYAGTLNARDMKDKSALSWIQIN
ncbi:MAG: hypothetical protein KH381_01840 [Clostridium sp.]|nr:hypothetical protein [Clostridium sp.]